MAEKYRGLIPSGSIWYKLSRDETIALLQCQGEWDSMSAERRATLEDADIQGHPGKIESLERLLAQAGINVTTLFD